MNTERLNWLRERDSRISSILPMDRVHKATAILGGVGALGNEVLKNLVLLGFGKIVVCDLDRIEVHNLTRSPMFHPTDLGRYKAEVAAEHARELNPDVTVVPFTRSIGELGLGVFRRADVLFSTFDGVVPRILVNAACMQVGTPWVDAGLGLTDHEAGEVALFNARDPNARCYTCGMDPQLVVKRLNGVRVPVGCGHMASALVDLGGAPTTPMMASVIAGIQVMAGLAVLAGQDADGKGNADSRRWKQSVTMWYNEMIRLDLYNRELLRIRNTRFEDCYHHAIYGSRRLTEDNIREVPEWVTKTTTAHEVLSRASEDLKSDSVVIKLHEPIVVLMECKACAKKTEVFQSLSTLRMARERRTCPFCGSDQLQACLDHPYLVNIDADSPFIDRPLGEIGIRPLDIIRAFSVDSNGEPLDEVHYEFSGDIIDMGLA